MTEAAAPGSKEKIYLHREAVITNQDILEACSRRFYSDGDSSFLTVDEDLKKMMHPGDLPKPTRCEVLVSFTKDAARRLADISHRQIRSAFAILVDGEVVYGRSVLPPDGLYEDVALSYRGMTAGDAEKLAQRLNLGCLPGKPDCMKACVAPNSANEDFRLEFRLGETSRSDGFEEAVLECTDQKVYLRRDAIATNKDITRAWVTPSPFDGKYDVRIEFTPDAAGRMARATGASRGKILAILINGKVVEAAIVHSQISTNAVLSGPVGNTKEAAQRLADALNRK